MTEDKKKTTISVRVEEDLHRSLRVLAAQRGVSIGELCKQALEEWLPEQPEKEISILPPSKSGKKPGKKADEAQPVS